MKIWALAVALTAILLLLGLPGKEDGLFPVPPVSGGGLGQTLEKLDRVLEPWEPVPVPASEAVDPSWFDGAAFVGDSVTVALERYSRDSGSLGAPAFLCAVSLSQSSALGYEPGNPNLPEWPKGSGRRPRLAEAAAESGASRIYLMLGMNCISGGVDKACRDLVTLTGEILERCPGAAILVQSVTPMTADSPRADRALNNGTIRDFNRQMQGVCRERGWYFVDVAEALADEAGALRADFSGDAAMGIHLNSRGAAAWASYLRTHVPKALKEGP